MIPVEQVIFEDPQFESDFRLCQKIVRSVKMEPTALIAILHGIDLAEIMPVVRAAMLNTAQETLYQMRAQRHKETGSQN